MTARYFCAFQKYFVFRVENKNVIKACIFKYFTGKKWQNDQNEIVITERKQTHAPFSLPLCHVSLPNLTSHNFCSSSGLLVFPLGCVSEFPYFPKLSFSVSVVKVVSFFFCIFWFFLRPVFLLSLFFIFPPFFVFLPAVVLWNNFSCYADAVRSCLELRKNSLWQLRVPDEFQAKQLFSEPSLDRPVLNL